MDIENNYNDVCMYSMQILALTVVLNSIQFQEVFVPTVVSYMGVCPTIKGMMVQVLVHLSVFLH